MGDYTAGQVIIYDCPEKYHEAVIGVLNNHGYGLEWDGKAALPLELGETYGAYEVAGDNSETVVSEIVALFALEDLEPGVPWKVGDETTCKRPHRIVLTEDGWQAPDGGECKAFWMWEPAPEEHEPRSRLADGERPAGLVMQAWTDPNYEWLGSLVIQTPIGSYAANCDSGGSAQFTREEVKHAVAHDSLAALLGDAYFDVLKPYEDAIQERRRQEAEQARREAEEAAQGGA